MGTYTNYAQFELYHEADSYYFKPFPYIGYDINGDGETINIKNFFKRFDFLDSVRKHGSIYIEWIVRDEDTPEIIAHKTYGTTHAYWIVLMINLMNDPTFSWPLTTRSLNDYIVAKYGKDNIRDTHHYESVDTGDEYDLHDGIIVDETYPHKITVTNEEYELKKNDAKRRIRILKNEYYHLVKNEWENLGKSKFKQVR